MNQCLKFHKETVFILYFLLLVINLVLPNVGRFLRYVLKNEQLGQEAESLRVRYDTLLGKLERMAKPVRHTSQQLRPISYTGDDTKLLHLRSEFIVFYLGCCYNQESDHIKNFMLC